ncbi:MAG: hypothetical protein IAG10_35270 [Planctomycetaceae bacterium]|nr:hypothetical protein [Planctomycetaceae bacterium]
MKTHPLWWSLVVMVATNQSFAGQRPQLVIECPTPQFKLAPDQPLVLKGRVQPAVSDVQFRLLQEQDSKFEFDGRTKARIDSDGTFQLRLFPTHQGWPLGEFLVEASLEEMRQVREMIKVVIAKDEASTKPDERCGFDDVTDQRLAEGVTLSIFSIKGDKYSRDSNLVVDGNIQGPLPKTVEIRLAHIAPNGRTRSLGGATVVPSHGRYAFDSNCWLGRWPSGIVRTTVWVPNSTTNPVSHDFQLVADEQPRPEKVLITIPPSSGVLIDVDDEKRRNHQVPIGKSFLVTGRISTFEKPEMHKLIGPRTALSVKDTRNVIMQSAGGISLREVPGVHWYEIEVGPLPFAGPHKLEVRRGKEVIRVIDVEAFEPGQAETT